MKATELRIGNWYSSGIDMETGEQVHNQVVPDLYMNWHVNGCWAKPIPLTEEWLVKFGFEPVFLENTDGEVLQDYHELNIDGFSKIVIESDFSFGIEDCRDTDCSVIFKNDILDSVHRLQNLYFALSGQELQTETMKQRASTLWKFTRNDHASARCFY